MRRAGMITVYSIVHFAVDFACAFLVVRAVPSGPDKLTALFLYNFCAFALQLPLGVLTDRFGHGRLFSAGGCLLVALSPLFIASPFMLCVLAGIGNALFHIGGGHDILASGKGKAGSLGVFVSPGALGLFVGMLVSGPGAPLWPVPPAMILCAALITGLCPRIPAPWPVPGLRDPRRSLSVMALLFLAVCLRSYGGFLFTWPWKSGAWAWGFVLCVVLGKTAGGFLYDRLGGCRAALASLLPAALLFVGAGRPVPGCLAVLLFNMTMPVTLRGAADTVRAMPGFSFGLLTLALFVGYIPVYAGFPAPDPLWLAPALCLTALALLLSAFRRKPA